MPRAGTRRYLLLAAAFLLLSAAAARMSYEDPIPTNVEASVRFPRDLPQKPRRHPKKEPVRTATVAARPVAATTKRPPASPAPPPQEPDAPRLDRFERSLFAPDGTTAMVIEVNAIRHSPLAEKLMRCKSGELMESLGALDQKLGVDALQDLDRVGFGSDALAVSGNFERMVLPPEAGPSTPYGSGASIQQIDDQWVGRVGNSLLLVAASKDGLERAIDRAEGRAPSAPPVDDTLAAGEGYATLGRDLLDKIFEGSADPLAVRLKELLTKGTARMLVDEHVSLSLDLTSSDPAAATDLAKSVGGALAALRMKAQSEDPAFAQLLSHARVLPSDGAGFGIDVALPGGVVLDLLGCKEDGSPKAKPETAPPAPTPPP